MIVMIIYNNNVLVLKRHVMKRLVMVMVLTVVLP
jgi:hypothetical protein